MSCIYAMSDIHGCLEAFEAALSLVDLSGGSKLVLLGDYLHGGPDPYGVLKRLMVLEKEYGRDKVIVLKGNHEEAALVGWEPISGQRRPRDEPYLRWMKKLRLVYTTERQIFCHAGIEEGAGEMWRWATDDYTFLEKYPAQTGPFYMDIIAGHIGTASISGNPDFHGIFFDGESHYYIDGSTPQSGIVPVLKVDTDTNRYFHVTGDGDRPVLPYQ